MDIDTILYNINKQYVNNQPDEDIYKYSKIYNMNDYIDVKYSEVKKQFFIDFPRIIFKYNNRKISNTIINMYLKSKKKLLKFKVMFFCTQIIFAPIITELYNKLLKINDNFIIAELDRNIDSKKHVVTQMFNNILSTTKILRIVDISNNNREVIKLIIHFTINYKKSNDMILNINFNI